MTRGAGWSLLPERKLRGLRTKSQQTTESVSGRTTWWEERGSWRGPIVGHRSWSLFRPGGRALRWRTKIPTFGSGYLLEKAPPGMPARLSLNQYCCTSGSASPSCHPLQPHFSVALAFLSNSNDFLNPTRQSTFSCLRLAGRSAGPFFGPYAREASDLPPLSCSAGGAVC